MSDKKLRVGIIGCGVIAPFHIEAFQKLQDAKLRGVVDVIESKAKDLAEKYKIDFWTSDYHRLLEEEVDIVDVCIPSGLHYQVALDAIKAGKHVIVEKPLAINLRQADEMIEASRKAGVKLAVILDHRFDPPSIKIKQALDKGRFGKLILGDAYVKWYRTQEYYSNDWRGTWNMDGGGILANQAIHWVDLLQWFMGPVDRVFARIKTATHKIEAADTAVALLEFKNGALGVIEASSSIYPGRRGAGVVYASLPERVEIYGERGSVVVEGSKNIKIWEFKDEEDTERTFQEETGEDEPVTGHKEEIKRIVQAVRENKDVPIDGEEGRKSLEIIRAIYYSSFTGKPVSFPFSHDVELDVLIKSNMKQRLRGGKLRMKIFKLKEGKRFTMGKGDARRILSPEEGVKNLTLNYAEFQPGQEFVQHIHKYSEDVIVILKGRGKIKVEGKDYPIEEGDVIYIPPGEKHGTIAGNEPMIAFSCQAPPDPDLYRGVYLKNTKQEEK